MLIKYVKTYCAIGILKIRLNKQQHVIPNEVNNATVYTT